MRLPSIKTIEKSFPYLIREDVKKIRKILENYCNSPEICLSKIDEILETYGVEYIEDSRDNCRQTQGILYCNAGDTYAKTILYDYDKGNYYISCWEDIVQRNPKRFGY
jgi:hypothetical protein